MSTGWEHFDHQADIGIRGKGTSLAAAFEQAALALIAVSVPLERIRPKASITISCEAPDQEILLADWLNAVLREMAVRKMVFGHFDVIIDGVRLEATAWGEPLDRDRHDPVVEVKAASYYELQVVRDQQGVWVAQCVVDV